MEERRSLVARIQRHLPEHSDVHVTVDCAGDVIELSGTVRGPAERQRALRVARRLAPTATVRDALQSDAGVPEPDGAPPDEVAQGDLWDVATPDTAVELIRELPSGPSDNRSGGRWDEENPGGTTFPPTDPVVARDELGDVVVLGGFTRTSMDDERVARSALDGAIGDEALRDAVVRELREDAATTDLALDVAVEDRVVYLRGKVPGLEDVDAAAEVAGRMPGVHEVVDDLEVVALESPEAGQ